MDLEANHLSRIQMELETRKNEARTDLKHMDIEIEVSSCFVLRLAAF